jgi:hypothetical protein
MSTAHRRRTGGEQPATSRQPPIRNNTRRQGGRHDRCIATGQGTAMRAFTRQRPPVAVLGARDGLLRLRSRSAGRNTRDRCGEPTAFWQRSSNPPWRGGGLIQRGGGFVEGRCRPRARRRRRCRVVGSRRSGGRAGAAWNQHPHPGVPQSVARPAPPPRGAFGDVGAADPRGSHHRCRAGLA